MRLPVEIIAQEGIERHWAVGPLGLEPSLQGTPWISAEGRSAAPTAQGGV